MGVLKRILRQTSNKLMSKLGAQRRSHRLVLSQPILSNCDDSIISLSHAPHYATYQPRTRPRNGPPTSGNRARRNKKQAKIHRDIDRIPKALLLAAKNHLPPVQFHHIHGPNAQLSKNKFVARRTQSFCHALVFSNRVILPNERVYIKVLEIADGWSGTIRFGFTSVDPATLRYQMPKHACPDMTNEGHTWARALADEVVRRNSVIHFSYSTNGNIHYGINNQDCGVFRANISTCQNLWFIVDIYGLTAAVELIDPRMHAPTSDSDLDETRISQQLENLYIIDYGQQASSNAKLPPAAAHYEVPATATLRKKQPMNNATKKNTEYGSATLPKPKTRQSTKIPKTNSNNSSNPDNNPTVRDCPICFERPINCVLYQCGHMCTCYECGVKQWRTQSRTCPICRTVIKDVIKTYMS